MKDLAKALLGCALGDSLGLPYEAFSRKKSSRLFKNLRQSLFFGRGMVSDDTEHSVMVILALNKSDNAEEFRRSMRSLLRRWLLTVPPGIGFGTLKAILKMWIGLKRTSTSSAGNGPLMRTAVLAVQKVDSTDFEEFVRVNAELTHGDERVYETSLIYGRLVQKATAGISVKDLQEVKTVIKGQEFSEIVRKMIDGLSKNMAPQEFFDSCGMSKGISGYCLHTFAGAVYPAIFYKGDFEETLSCIIRAGGDTDSVGAVAGALCAVMPGTVLPPEHLKQLKDWPLSVQNLEAIAAGGGICCLFVKMLLRNILFVPLILIIAVLRIFR